MKKIRYADRSAISNQMNQSNKDHREDKTTSKDDVGWKRNNPGRVSEVPGIPAAQSPKAYGHPLLSKTVHRRVQLAANGLSLSASSSRYGTDSIQTNVFQAEDYPAKRANLQSAPLHDNRDRFRMPSRPNFIRYNDEFSRVTKEETLRNQTDFPTADNTESEQTVPVLDTRRSTVMPSKSIMNLRETASAINKNTTILTSSETTNMQRHFAVDVDVQDDSNSEPEKSSVTLNTATKDSQLPPLVRSSNASRSRVRNKSANQFKMPQRPDFIKNETEDLGASDRQNENLAEMQRREQRSSPQGLFQVVFTLKPKKEIADAKTSNSHLVKSVQAAAAERKKAEMRNGKRQSADARPESARRKSLQLTRKLAAVMSTRGEWQSQRRRHMIRTRRRNIAKRRRDRHMLLTESVFVGLHDWLYFELQDMFGSAQQYRPHMVQTVTQKFCKNVLDKLASYVRALRYKIVVNLQVHEHRSSLTMFNKSLFLVCPVNDRVLTVSFSSDHLHVDLVVMLLRVIPASSIDNNNNNNNSACTSSTTVV